MAYTERELQRRFAELSQTSSRQVFHDPCTGDWTQYWFLDGERASVTNTEDGMTFAAGPVAGDNGSHAVLWTRADFTGDLKIEFDYERLDTINRFVNILYILATGIGDEGHEKDIATWAHQRTIPYMPTYWRYMNLLHISYAAFGNKDDEPSDYVRARRYPVTETHGFNDIDIPPDYPDTGLFTPGERYHFIVIKKGHELFMKVEGAETERLFFWDTSDFPLIEEGRIGIRHMHTRCSRYGSFTVHKLD